MEAKRMTAEERMLAEPVSRRWWEVKKMTDFFFEG
jgi:hypothetical protein